MFSLFKGLLNRNKVSLAYLTDIKYEDTVEFTFPITEGKVIKVYDADTITIASKLPYKESPIYRLSVRLNGIDAPEDPPDEVDHLVVLFQLPAPPTQ